MSESILKISRLNDSENYNIWAIWMKTVLTEKGYYSVITDTENIDDEKKTKALAYIHLSLLNESLL